MGFCLKCKPVFRGFQFSTSHLLCFLQPLGQDGFQLARILEAQLQVLKAANRRLAELRAMHGSQCFSNVGLCVTCQKQRGKATLKLPGRVTCVEMLPLTAGSVGSVCCSAFRLSVLQSSPGVPSWAHLLRLLLVSVQRDTDLVEFHTPGLGIWEGSTHPMSFCR